MYIAIDNTNVYTTIYCIHRPVCVYACACVRMQFVIVHVLQYLTCWGTWHITGMSVDGFISQKGKAHSLKEETEGYPFYQLSS